MLQCQGGAEIGRRWCPAVPIFKRHHCSGTYSSGNYPASPLGKHSKGRATLRKMQGCWLTSWWLTNFLEPLDKVTKHTKLMACMVPADQVLALSNTILSAWEQEITSRSQHVKLCSAPKKSSGSLIRRLHCINLAGAAMSYHESFELRFRMQVGCLGVFARFCSLPGDCQGIHK